MKKHLPTILTLMIILAIGVAILTPNIAMATVSGTSIVTGVGVSVINTTLANIGNAILGWTAGLVTAGGAFLSMAINLTTHIDKIYETVSGIKSVWVTIRDISSIFIIFALLYFSIRTILGFGGYSTTGNLKGLIVNIFIAGLLINFSLFFVRVAIDASNLVSLQFYNAIAPDTSKNWSVGDVFNNGGLSNVFMQSLKIPTIYQQSKSSQGFDIAAGIGFAILGGIIMMVTAAISFFAAAIAFTARTAILLFVMAMSPIFFVGMIFPEVKKKVSDKISGLLYSQCVFMPVYLFLMYIALKIISDENFMKIFNPNTSGVADTNGFGPVWIGIIIQYAIALIFINIPLVAAIEMGAIGMKWAPGSSGANAVNKWLGGKIGGFAGRNIAGRAGQLSGVGFDRMAASAQGSSLGKGTSTVLRALGISQGIRGGLTATEKGKYGGTQSLGDIQKENKERARTISGVQRMKEQHLALAAVIGSKNTSITPAQMDKFRETVDKMGNKDFENMNFETIKDPVLASNLSSKQAESLLEGDILTSQQKDEFKKIRKDKIVTIINSGTATDAEIHMKKLSGKELSKMDKTVIKNPNVLKYLTPTQLLEMRDIDGDTKKFIGDYIENTALGDHKAKGYIRKNRTEWS